MKGISQKLFVSPIYTSRILSLPRNSQGTISKIFAKRQIRMNAPSQFPVEIDEPVPSALRSHAPDMLITALSKASLSIMSWLRNKRSH
jgi:hypothetical protein